MAQNVIILASVGAIGVAIALAAHYDERRGKIPSAIPLIIMGIGAICGAAMGRLNVYVEGIALGAILTYVLWMVGAIGGGDAKILAGVFAFLRTVNPPAGESVIYLTFISAMVGVYLKRRNEIQPKIQKILEKDITSEDLKNIVRIFLLISALYLPIKIMSGAYITFILGIYLMGIAVWIIESRFGRMGLNALTVVGAMVTAILIKNREFGTILFISTIAVTLALIRIPLILSFPDATEKIPIYNPFVTKATLIKRKSITLGKYILIGYLIAAAATVLAIT